MYANFNCGPGINSDPVSLHFFAKDSIFSTSSRRSYLLSTHHERLSEHAPGLRHDLSELGHS